jgi:hypothetical protein
LIVLDLRLLKGRFCKVRSYALFHRVIWLAFIDISGQHTSYSLLSLHLYREDGGITLFCNVGEFLLNSELLGSWTASIVRYSTKQRTPDDGQSPNTQ